MRKKPSGLGLAFLVLAVAASVPVGGCRGESPVRVIRTESSGVGTAKEFSQEVEPVNLRLIHEPDIAIHFNYTLKRAVEDLERPIGPDEKVFGRNRLFKRDIGDHKVFFVAERFFLFGNKTSKLSPETWSGTQIGFPTSEDPQDEVRERNIVEPYARQAVSHFLSGVREPIRWNTKYGAMEARPVVLKDASCLRCHAEGRIGDVAGLLIMKLSEEDLAKYRIDRPRNP